MNLTKTRKMTRVERRKIYNYYYAIPGMGVAFIIWERCHFGYQITENVYIYKI